MKKYLHCYVRVISLLLVLLFVSEQNCYAKKEIVPPYNPVEHKLPLKVSIANYDRGYRQQWDKLAPEILPFCKQYFNTDISINYIDTTISPIGTIDIRCICFNAFEPPTNGGNIWVTRFSFDIVDNNHNLIQSYIYSIEGNPKKSIVVRDIMSKFRIDYIRDYEQLFAALQSPKPIKKAILTICDPSSKERDPKLKCFVELDGKRVGYIANKSYKSYEVTTGWHKLAAYYNSYQVSGFMNFTRSMEYTDDPNYARRRNMEEMDTWSLPTGVAERIVYIQEGENFVDLRKIVYGNDERANQTISQEEVNEFLTVGMLINPNTLPQYNSANASITQIETPISNTYAPRQSIQQSLPQSDVDKNISQSTTKSTNTYILIIANEDYEYLDDVNYASNDGKIFKEYCIKTLGVPEKQIFYYENATVGKISDGVGKLKYCLDNFAGARAIVYYCGHGIPDEKSNQAYLIPTDGKATNTSICYSLNKLYKTLAATKAQSITYFMDACFTGANKEGSMLVAARGVARAPEKETLAGKTIVFSASSGDETAMTLKDEGHGLFTYYLLKKLQETNGDVTYGELANYINQNVKKDAFLINEKPQTPVVATSPAVVNTWKSMKLK